MRGREEPKSKNQVRKKLEKCCLAGLFSGVLPAVNAVQEVFRKPSELALFCRRLTKDHPGDLMKKMTALLLLAAAGSTYAADWKTVYVDDTQVVQYDAGMLKHQGSHVLLWTRFSYAKPQTVGEYTYDVMLGRYNINCADDTSVLLSSGLGLDGKKVTTLNVASDSSTIFPDSPVAKIEKAVCPA